MGWVGNAASLGERSGTDHILVGETETKTPLTRVDEIMILNWIFQKWDGGMNWI
jgi:hypothetical protein